jgi:hypothetical protein
MGEPVLRLVIPEPAGTPGPAPRWPANSRPAAAEVAPGNGATSGATTVIPDGANEGATSETAGPEAGATNGATGEAGTAAASPATDAGGEGELPELKPIGRPMTAAERSARLARRQLAQARANVMRPGELAHAAWHGKPNSLAEIHDYAVTRAWVPDDYEGSLVPVLGAVYSHTVAKGGTALGLLIIWITQRALRLAVFLFVCGVLAGIALIFG